MSTVIFNVTGGAASLPAPYRGVLGPGKGAIVSDAMATVVTNLGGADNISSIFRLETSAAPGNPANDPLPATPGVSYSNTTRPAATAVGASATTPVWIFNSSDHAPQYSDGVNWYDASGNLS